MHRFNQKDFQIFTIQNVLIFSFLFFQNSFIHAFSTGNESVRDEFSSASYSNNDGSQNWSGAWVEEKNGGTATDPDGTAAGNIQIVGGQLRFEGIAGADPFAYREVNLVGASFATLTFDITTSGNLEETGDIDQFQVQISNNGGAGWNTLETFSGDITASRSYDITAYIASNTQIRLWTPQWVNDGGEYYFIDNVNITYDPPGPGTVSCANPTEIGGVIFNDANANGTCDVGEGIVENVDVSIFDDNGQVGTTIQTDSEGEYLFTGLTLGANYRIEISIPTGMDAGPEGTHSKTAVQFVTAGSCDNSLGIQTPECFCDDDPFVIVPCYVEGAYNGTYSTEAAIAKVLESADGHDFTGTTKTANYEASMIATHGQVGSVYGVAWQNTTSRYYAAAFHKRYVGFGPDGPDAIYQLDMNGNVTGSIELDDLLPGTNNAGSDVHDFTPVGGEVYDLGTGDASFDAVGKRSFGDIEISEDGTTLYVVNLFDRKIYALDITDGNTANVTIVTSWNAPDATGASRHRPFGLAIHDGKLWIGSVDEDGTDAYVHSLDPSGTTFNLELTIDMTYARQAYMSADANTVDRSAEWRAWATNSTITPMASGSNEISYPQAMLSDIEFATDSAMILGFRDRFGDQSGGEKRFNTSATDDSWGTTAGDILKACYNSGSYIIETGTAGACTGTGGITGSGPGGVEFYHWDSYNFDNLTWNPNATTGMFHWETAQGGLLQLKGRSYVMTTAMDPFHDFSGGMIKLDNSTGGREGIGTGSSVYANLTGGYTMFESGDWGGTPPPSNGTLSKANGLGDLEAACSAIPMEIGDFVWVDTDADGIQDPSENGLSGVTVTLTDNNDIVVATTTTDANGKYVFNDGNVVGGLSFYTIYKVKISLSAAQATNSNIGNVSPQNSGNGENDNDAILIGNDAVATLTTGGSGEITHAIDFGFAPAGVIGNRIWLDENGNGLQDAGEPGIANVVVELQDGTCTSGVDCPTTITDADGGYIFRKIIFGTYTVAVLSGVPVGLNPIYDENDGTTSPDMTTSVVLNNEEYLTANFGYNWTPASDTDAPAMNATGAIGNRIWNDKDGDGFQDLAELGINNISVNLYSDPDEDGVFDNLVATTTTDAYGHYIFDGVVPDAYIIEVSQSDLNTAGFTNPATSDPDGDTDNITNPIIIAPGDVYVNADFGYKNATNLADIGDYIFVDVNADNTFTLGTDIGMAGVSVALIVDTNGDGDWDIGEEVAATTLTAFDGSYLFTDAPAGDYIVVVTDTDNILVGLENSTDPDGGNDGYSGITLAAANNFTQDFGYVPFSHGAGDGFVGDYIFLDADGSDSYTAGEIGIEGVEVNLLDGVTDAVLTTTTTNKLGFYFFGNLPADDYKVQVVTATLPSGLMNSVDPEGAGGNNISNSFALGAGTTTLTKDFGYKATSPRIISGTIWEDENADGTFDAAETDRFESISVVLKNSNGKIIGIAATASDGTYSFNGVPDSETYTVDVKEVHNYLEGYWHTTGTDSEPDYTTVTLSGADATGVDFGYYKAGASLGNRVWIDSDADGLQDANELGMRYATVTLEIDYNNDGTAEITTSAISGANGYYQFNNLLLDEDYNGGGAAPDFTIKMIAPAGYTSTTIDTNSNANDREDADNMSGVVATAIQGGNDMSIQANPTLEPTEASYDFGLVETGIIGNRVWVDENADGIQDAGEPGIGGVTVELVNGSSVVVATVITDSDGGYLFKNIAPGTYTVRVGSGIPTGLDNIIYDEDNGTTSPDEESSVTIGSGEEHLTAEFGYNYVTKANTDAPSLMTATGALGNRIWNDADGDGIQDLGEAGIPNITVNLYSDPENDGTFTNLVTSTTTNANGKYMFDNLSPDGYVIEVVTAGISAAGFTTTPTSDPDNDSDNITETIIIAPGDVWLGGDFGFNNPSNPADIGSTVFVDVDADGTYNVMNDIPLAGVTIALVDDGNGNGIWDAGEGVVATTETASDGTYLFPDLPADNYVVHITDSDNVIDNLTNSTDPDGGNDSYSGVTLGGTDELTENFGYLPLGHTMTTGFIGDMIYFDSDGSGSFNAGDSGLEGVEVQLLDGMTDVVLEKVMTNENGLYFFGGLDADDYKVKVNTATVPSGMTNSVDPDGSAPGDDETNSFSLASGANDMTKDFGYTATTSFDISGTIWKDTDAEGELDVAETGRFENVTIELQDANGNIIASTSTDANGDYTFAGIPNGTYTVEVTDVNEVLENQWHSLGTDSENDPVDVIVSGTNITDVDFGYYTEPAGLGNYVWDDTDGDGIQDNTESGLSGVVVTLEIDYDNDGNADVTVATLTDGSGYYNFKNLLLDEDYNGDGNGTEPTYTLSAATPSSYTNTIINANSNGNDKEDADDPSGVVANAIQGSADLSVQANPNAETTPATFDFGFRLIALPVQLSAFKAKTNGCSVELSWVTESEEDFHYFEVEWSGNGQDYRTLHKVKANGGNFSQYYDYKDAYASSYNYYRLKMVDIDGTYEYSNVEQAYTDCEDVNDVQLYPNPLDYQNSLLNVRFYAERPQSEIIIIDMLGRVVKKLTLDLDAESINVIQLDITDLPVGNYTLQISGNRTSKTFSIQE